MFVTFALLAALPTTCAMSADEAGRRSSETRRVIAIESSGAVDTTAPGGSAGTPAWAQDSLESISLDSSGDSQGRGTQPDSGSTPAWAKDNTSAPANTSAHTRCCCNQQAPLGPAYLCFDKQTNELFTTVSTKKKTKGIVGSERAQSRLQHTPTIVTASKCGSKGEAIFGAAAADIQPATPKEIAALKKQEKGIILEAHAEKVTADWGRYVFPTQEYVKKKMFKKYMYHSSANMADELLSAHIVMNGVVYGPHSTQNSVSDSLHGVPVCTKWQKTAKTFVKGHRPGAWSNKAKFKPSFDIKTQEWTFGTECIETYTCIEQKIGHACGFDHDDVIFLKHKGRADGICEEPTKKGIFGSEHCPSGMFHEKGNCKVTGTCHYYFCDCGASSQRAFQEGRAPESDALCGKLDWTK